MSANLSTAGFWISPSSSLMSSNDQNRSSEKSSAITLSGGKVELAIRLERAEQSSDVSINLEKLSEMKYALDKVIELMPDARAPSALEILMTQGIWVSDKLDVEALNKECIAVMPGIVESLRSHRLEEGARLEELLIVRWHPSHRC